MKCWVKRLWIDGRKSPKHMVAMQTLVHGSLGFSTVKNDTLGRPATRLRFRPDAGKPFPDLYDVELQSVDDYGFEFRGIEAPSKLSGNMNQHFAQAWLVCVNEPDWTGTKHVKAKPAQ